MQIRETPVFTRGFSSLTEEGPCSGYCIIIRMGPNTTEELPTWERLPNLPSSKLSRAPRSAKSYVVELTLSLSQLHNAYAIVLS